MKPIVLVGEALGESELKLGGLPLVGPSGAELLRMLSEAGVIHLTTFDRDYIRRYYLESNPAHIAAIWDLHPEVYRTNVFAVHPPKNDLLHLCGDKASAIPGYPALLKSKYVRKEYEPELTRLADELLRLDPNVVVCLGNTPLWALAGQTGISKIRGTTLLSTHTVLDFKLLPTYHPAAVTRDWSLRPTTIADLMKAKRESAYANIRRPPREIWIEPTLDDIRDFISRHVRGCPLLSVDIETSGHRVTCIGFAPTPEVAIVIPFDDPRTKSGCYWTSRSDERKCWDLVRSVLEDRTIPKLFQNGAYDISFLLRSYGIRTYGAAEDTMLLSHSLQPEALKGLGYLGSIYSDEGSWKFMRKKEETIKRGS
jgi:uracil-DNA glycosylase